MVKETRKACQYVTFHAIHQFLIMIFHRSQTEIVIALDSDGILNLQYLRLYCCHPLEDLRSTDKPNKPLHCAPRKPWCVDLWIRLKCDGIASLGNLFLCNLQMCDKWVQQTRGYLLLATICYHN
uniref:Uncharacterized protein n=1 Tax=Arundo donax TaxID=35708 RepID=A0A0A9B3E8_ARUDO